MTDLDPTTGLPQLPAGYRFAVQHRYVVGYGSYYRSGYEVALEKERRGLFGGQKWRRVSTETIYDRVESDGGEKLETADTLTDENIREAAERLETRRVEKATEIAVEKKYLGTYPPKSL